MTVLRRYALDPMAKNTARSAEDEGRAARDTDSSRLQHAIRAKHRPKAKKDRG
jgi:hypothetical protein